MHAVIATLPGRFAHDLEGAYIDRASLWEFVPNQRRHPGLGADWPFGWIDHGATWMLERWTVRESGVVLHGPPTDSIIAPISLDEVRASIADILGDWVRGFDEAAPYPSWIRPPSRQAFAVDTMSRALMTLATGQLPTKAQAVAWAMDRLPEPWLSLLKRSRAWRLDHDQGDTTLPEIAAFVRWAATDGQSWAARQ